MLINHPDVELRWVNSNSNAGNKCATCIKVLWGKPTSSLLLKHLSTTSTCCSAALLMEKAANYRFAFDSRRLRIIDLSTDFRNNDGSHDFVYGLPELNRRTIVNGARHIANPGCFATCIQLALLPLAKNLLLNSVINVTAITGSTGAGVKPSPTSHYSWRNDNVSIYKPFKHQHLAEIKQSLTQLQHSFKSDINFIPMRGCFSRGILASVYLDCPIDLDVLRELYDSYYDDHNFTFVIDRMPDLKDVVNTNKCLLHLVKEDGNCS